MLVPEEQTVKGKITASAELLLLKSKVSNALKMVKDCKDGNCYSNAGQTIQCSIVTIIALF